LLSNVFEKDNVNMLEDKTTDYYLKTHILKDEYMSNYRKVFFNDKL
jgi:hypothetical protein